TATYLIYTPDTLRRARQRVAIIRTIRGYLDAKGFLEVETPTLHAIAGGAAARPSVTHHNVYGPDLFLRIALDLPRKPPRVGGLRRPVPEVRRVRPVRPGHGQARRRGRQDPARVEGREDRHADAEGARRAGARAVRASRRGQAGRPGVRVRLPRGALPADQAED